MQTTRIPGALLVAATLAWAAVACAQEEGVRLMNARTARMQLTRAARLGTSALGYADTAWVGHRATPPYGSYNPFRVGVGPYRPGVNPDGCWDFDRYDGGNDSLQGWLPTVSPNTRSVGTLPDDWRPWQCLDWGNRINATPVQGRTIGVVSAWHVDDASLAGSPAWKPAWLPLAGTSSAWCGLRAGNDPTFVDDVARGGTGNPYSGDIVVGLIGDGVHPTQKDFPGYMNQWDQMLYRDVRVADGGSLTVSFRYETYLDPRTNTAAGACRGWFDRDPLSATQGPPFGPGPANFVSASNHPSRGGPVDSFMVYVGVPADPAACQYSDGLPPRPIHDLKRRWFSEVLAVDKPYKEIVSTFGFDSVYRSEPFSTDASPSTLLGNAVVQPMLDATPGPGGIVRIVFRVKTNSPYSDETGTGGTMTTYGRGGVRVDAVTISGCVDGPLVSGFDAPAEIDNRIEPADAVAAPAVGEGYALARWHATGKPPKHMVHTHPLAGGDIGGGNVYAPLEYADVCGPPDSPMRQCDIDGVVVSTGDHDLGEATGGALGTPFKENRSGLLGPTINMVTPFNPANALEPNDIGLDRYHVYGTSDWLLWHDIYTGVFNITVQGNVWGSSVMCWPAVQANGATAWGDLGYITGVWYDPDKQCFPTTDLVKPCIYTSNPSGYPDSMKLWVFREQRCISWTVTTGCSPTDGHYLDNVTLCIPPSLIGCGDEVTVDLWDWYNDTFPANETPGLPGSATFDTCGAHVMSARNFAPTAGTALRFDVPGDTMLVRTTNYFDTPQRMDLVFRILPGPGNHVVVGNKASGLRRVPQGATPAVAGDPSFWGQYLANNGEFGTPGGHAGGAWDPDVWNSARCDTAERNLFPVEGKTANLPGFVAGQYASMLHEDDPKFAMLGIPKHRCFLVDTLAGLPDNSDNITCSSVPPWVTGRPGTGYGGDPLTREYTKIIPDGLLTSGSSVQYFFRMCRLAAPNEWPWLNPDTMRITPQETGAAYDFDAKRWEHFGVLPDRWKDAAFGGLGSACFLVADYNDRRGDEKVWVGAMDSIGATVSARYGAHNGWHATAAYVAPDGSHDFTGWAVPNDPTICVFRNGGLPGTTWDLYNVHAIESSSTASAQLGSRLANRADMGLLSGRFDRHGPTPEMLRAYYRLVFIMSGDLNTSFFGAAVDRGQDDIALLTDFLTAGADPAHPRGIWAMGNGFVESGTGIDTQHDGFLANVLACSLRDPSYFALSGATKPMLDLLPTSVVTPSGAIYGVENSCLFTNDVLHVNAGVPGATAGAHYEDLGANGPYVASVYAPSTTGHPFVSLVSAWDMTNLFSREGGNTVGRLQYFMDVSTRVFGSICPFNGYPATDVPQNTAAHVDFLGHVWGNPLAGGGRATLRFGLARADRVRITVHDVAGRAVRTLADRAFPAGEQTLTWDGTGDDGRPLARGVYFTRVRYLNGGFEEARKLTILR